MREMKIMSSMHWNQFLFINSLLIAFILVELPTYLKIYLFSETQLIVPCCNKEINISPKSFHAKRTAARLY